MSRFDETTGILAGGLLGGVAGWPSARQQLAVPGVGVLVAAGSTVAAVSGSGLRAAAGSALVGHFMDQGLLA